jgi:NSS family neurotransmitter:Na+ symporter
MTESGKERSTFSARFGYLAAMTAIFAGPAAMFLIPFRAVAYGGGSFWIWFLIGYFIIVIPIYIMEAGLGVWSRKASPQTWRSASKGKRLFTFVAWATVLGAGLPPAIYILTAFIGSASIYFFGAPFKIWTSHPGGFFFGSFVSNDWLLFLAPVLWFITWLFTYKSINIWAKAILWFKPISTVLMAVVLTWTLVNFKDFKEAWSLVFNLKPTGLISFGIISSAVLWCFFRTSAGYGLGITFASYLPRGGDVTDTVFLAGIWDVLYILMAALWAPVLILGVGIPPSFGGAIGLVFSAIPNAWNATAGIGGTYIAMLVYLLIIVGGYPIMVAMFEYITAAFVDEFGVTRTKMVGVLAIACLLISFLYTLPLHDGLNGEGWGWTLTFAGLFWVTFFSLVAAFFEYILVFRYFKVSKLIETVNSTSIIKVGSWFRYVLYAGFALTTVVLFYELVASTGAIPGISPGDFGTILGDGTVGWNLKPEGLAIIAMFVAAPIIAALALTFAGSKNAPSVPARESEVPTGIGQMAKRFLRSFAFFLPKSTKSEK